MGLGLFQFLCRVGLGLARVGLGLVRVGLACVEGFYKPFNTSLI